MRLLVTGGCGFLGSNLVRHALSRGDQVAVVDTLARLGAEENLSWLRSQSGSLTHHRIDVRDAEGIAGLVGDFSPDAIFHVAGQVAMTTSIADPRTDFEINALGTLNVLEAVRRRCPGAAVLYSSTNKVFGDLSGFAYREEATRWVCTDRPNGFDESTPLGFHSPYGCSKGAADQYVLDYARIFGLRTAVFRHSSMYGGRQFATYDQGWIGWFCQQAVESARGGLRKPFTISGDGKQVRDVLHADDMVELYFQAAERISAIAGQAFCIGGGVANSLSLLELFAHLERILGKALSWERLPARSSDQRIFIADLTKVRNMLGWAPRVGVEEGLRRMVDWTMSRGPGA
jgi:CDP-paratose 2-epimerase